MTYYVVCTCLTPVRGTIWGRMCKAFFLMSLRELNMVLFRIIVHFDGTKIEIIQTAMNDEVF